MANPVNRNNNMALLCLCSAIVLSTLNVARGEQIVMNDGRRIFGRIVSQSRGRVTIDAVISGIVTFAYQIDTADITSIIESDPAAMGPAHDAVTSERIITQLNESLGALYRKHDGHRMELWEKQAHLKALHQRVPAVSFKTTLMSSEIQKLERQQLRCRELGGILASHIVAIDPDLDLYLEIERRAAHDEAERAARAVGGASGSRTPKRTHEVICSECRGNGIIVLPPLSGPGGIGHLGRGEIRCASCGGDGRKTVAVSQTGAPNEKRVAKAIARLEAADARVKNLDRHLELTAARIRSWASTAPNDRSALHELYGQRAIDRQIAAVDAYIEFSLEQVHTRENRLSSLDSARRDPHADPEVEVAIVSLKVAHRQVNLLHAKRQRLEARPNGGPRPVFWTIAPEDLNSLVQLAQAHASGKGETQDTVVAHALFTMAARNGHVGAQVVVGRMWLYGEGTDPNTQLAEHMLRDATDFNDAMAPLIMAMAYGGDVHGVPVDHAAQIAWLEESACLGNPIASAQLHAAYLAGDPFPKDDARATYWLRRSYAQVLARSILGAENLLSWLPETENDLIAFRILQTDANALRSETRAAADEQPQLARDPIIQRVNGAVDKLVAATDVLVDWTTNLMQFQEQEQDQQATAAQELVRRGIDNYLDALESIEGLLVQLQKAWSLPQEIIGIGM